ncbi:GNAT family N-acetyltransferase [Clostridium sp. YIM B02515]|uniref:GNAT family N-acetyltransferase n=1 Tax=Clostridium rhizosphaerae TaxID=2803861 RepID=A0ABS1T4D3_9CLOT|nr:GNAT family protein [Clostridium rhizosphaerae]MBL4934180.1 GNAT family N-acetyltransferase [Clostridium rhizosphaerae]
MFIKQGDLTIRNATIEDAPILGKWWRDGAVMAHAGFPKGLNITDNEIAAQVTDDTDETRRRLIIEYCNTPIGEMSYYNKGNGIAEIGIKICDFQKQEKGYGTRFLNMLISTLFYKYGYSKIILDTNLNNKRAQHVYEKLGFRKVRVNMDSWKDQLDELQSSVDYEMTKDDFKST